MAYPMSMLSIEVAAAIPKNKISEMVDNVLAQEAKPADKIAKFPKEKIPPDIITASTKVSPNTDSQDYLNQDEADTNVEYPKGRAYDQAGVGALQVQGGEGRRALVQAGGSHDTPQKPRWGNSRTKKYQEEQGFVRMLYKTVVGWEFEGLGQAGGAGEMLKTQLKNMTLVHQSG